MDFIHNKLQQVTYKEKIFFILMENLLHCKNQLVETTQIFGLFYL